MNYAIFDLESDGLLDNTVSTPDVRIISRIHCVCVRKVVDGKVLTYSLTKKDEIIRFFETEELLIGHNIRRYDIPAIQKLVPNIQIKARLIDTLALSWYLFPLREEHGLESWGETFGIQKPPIDDWENLTIEEYIFRCSEDVKINTALFDLIMEYLFELYGDGDKVKRLINYLMFKMDCAQEQEEVGWKVDMKACEEGLVKLGDEEGKRVEALKIAMPKVIEYSLHNRPKVFNKKDGSVSALGEKWLALLRQQGLPEHHLGTIKIPVREEPGNPGSHPQLKAWLYSLGWIPETFKYVKDKKTKEVRVIPQISLPEGAGVCDSIKKLYPVCPELENLDGLFVVKHRVGLLNGFVKNRNRHGFVKAEIKGFTNTLRFQHTTVVNLPTIQKVYGDIVRGCLIAPDDDHILCGSDMTGLEDNTKRHYMFYYDPEYVREMMEFKFDAHCDIAVLAKKMSKDEETFYKWYDAKKEGQDHQRVLDDYEKKSANMTLPQMLDNSITGLTLWELVNLSPEEQGKMIKALKPIRSMSKKVNFAAVYLAGPPKIAQTGNMPLSEARVLHKIYWQRNWAVKKIAETSITKSVRGQMWLFNPVSQLWYSLRDEKDRFSTLNQGTGVYCFDTQVRNVRKRGIKICGQFHDEFIFPLKKGQEEYYSKLLDEAIIDTNAELQLNITLGISKDFGRSYAEIH